MVDNLGFESQHEKEIFLFCKTTGSALGPTQPHIQWLPEFFEEGKATELCNWPLNDS